MCLHSFQYIQHMDQESFIASCPGRKKGLQNNLSARHTPPPLQRIKLSFTPPPTHTPSLYEIGLPDPPPPKKKAKIGPSAVLKGPNSQIVKTQ
jgi:hypothetical protein